MALDCDTMPPLAVNVQQLLFSFGRITATNRPEIDNVDLNVPRGVIYGLLGPSGCGKTTLLRCIIGRLKPQKGSVRVFNTKPGTKESGIPGPGIGYMPQELALISQFTIKETLYYYGGFCCTNKTLIGKRIQFLLQLLDLMEMENKFVDKLSGGQKRRVSLAIALINNPPLLILDEPTVGVDPILRETIWNYLVKISKEGLTVIVTTHYIEEARSADIVGFMRSGHILSEGNPNKLMANYCVSSMEQLFLILSRNDEMDKHLQNNRNNHALQKQQPFSNGSNNGAANNYGNDVKKRNAHQNMAYALNNEEKLQQNAKTYICNGSNGANDYIVGKYPVNSIYSVTEVYTQIEPDLHINNAVNIAKHNELVNFKNRMNVRPVDRIGVLCNKNRLRLFRRIPELIITMLLPALEVALFCLCMGRDPTNVQMAVSNQEFPPLLSSIFLNSIDDKFISLKYYPSHDEAIGSVREAESYSAMVISENFSRAINKLYRYVDPENLRDGIDNQTLDDSTIKIYYDASNALHVNVIRREVFSAVFKFAETVSYTIGYELSRFKLPVKFEQPIYGREKADMIEFVGPGLMVFIVFFATMSITSMAFLSERREGTLERSMISGVTSTEFIIAQIINITLLLITQITLTVIMGFWIFEFPMQGSYALAITMMFLQGICGMCYGLMLSSICTHEITALLLGAGSILPFCFMTGLFWPIETMTPFLRYISYLIPQTKPMESFRHILIRGFNLCRSSVYNGFLITGCWIAFFLIAAIVIFKLR